MGEIYMMKRRHTPVMTILFAMTTSLLLYQNCSPNQLADSATEKGSANSSTVGLNGNGSGAIPVGAIGGAIPVMPGSGTGGTGGSGGNGAIPTTPGSGTGGTGTGGGTGTNPDGSTGGNSSNSLMWQFQPEDRTIEEGEVLTLASYATKGIDTVTYQWYKNGSAIAGQTGYMYRVAGATPANAGKYYVVARSGANAIESIGVIVKVKAPRNACAAGRYGVFPGARTPNYSEYLHESVIGKNNAPFSIPTELADGYSIRLPYITDGGACVAATGIFQCRNGKLISMDLVGCTQLRDNP